MLSRFVAGGVINGVISFSVMFVLMLFSVSAVAANVCGYAAGLASSFMLNRRFVFVAKGRVNRELIRFLAAFGVSFLANLGVLRFLIALPSVNAYVAQLIAAATYTVVMFTLCDAFVFTARDSRSR